MWSCAVRFKGIRCTMNCEEKKSADKPTSLMFAIVYPIQMNRLLRCLVDLSNEKNRRSLVVVKPRSPFFLLIHFINISILTRGVLKRFLDERFQQHTNWNLLSFRRSQRAYQTENSRHCFFGEPIISSNEKIVRLICAILMLDLLFSFMGVCSREYLSSPQKASWQFTREHPNTADQSKKSRRFSLWPDSESDSLV